MLNPRLHLGSSNAFKLGLFGVNVNCGRILTTVPEHWSGTWDDNLQIARLCDAYGIEFIVPVGRWKGYGGATDHQGKTLETLTWATGLLCATDRVHVFGTVHAPLFHPLVAAKQMVTADHVGHGRFGLNVVAGWNEDEFRMFGLQQREHDARYAYAQEWIDIVRRTWEAEEFDFAGHFFELSGVKEDPKPYGNSRPVVMNAGMTPSGRAFAMQNSDMYFTGLHLKSDMSSLADEVARVKSEALGRGRDISVFSTVFICCRPTRAEAEAYALYAIEEHADWEAMDRLLEGRRTMLQSPDDMRRAREAFPRAALGPALVGDPDDVAAGLGAYAAAGIDGLALTFVNFLDELPFVRETVIPRLENMGHRRAAAALTTR